MHQAAPREHRSHWKNFQESEISSLRPVLAKQQNSWYSRVLAARRQLWLI